MAAPDCIIASPRMSFAIGEEREFMESGWMAALGVTALGITGTGVIGVKVMGVMVKKSWKI